MYTIVQAPNAILRTKAKAVDSSFAGLKAITNQMVETMIAQKDPEGVGLAANQVNLPWKIFVARFNVKKGEPVRVFVNPEITSHSEEQIPTATDKKSPLEGCLSKPDYYGLVKRWRWVTLNYQDENGEMRNEKFEGFPATVVQHEMDHLNGKIFIERILEQQGRLYKVKRGGKKGKDEWEEVEI